MFWKNKENFGEDVIEREEKDMEFSSHKQDFRRQEREEVRESRESVPVLEMHVHFAIKDRSQIGRVALILAATTDDAEESKIRESVFGAGWKAVATEVGGLAGSLPQKVTRAVVGAALNSGVVEKTSNEMHALMHAALEATGGFMSPSMLEASVGAKIAIVRNDGWVAVAIVGDTAYHAVAHHERCGLGVMHI
ncbi:MAG TPA: HutP family protein [Synergistaceae bacterium]|nr:HutP family protein [Synergistaceae bacterium]HPJ25448.1 HutP family protein [Synergistaceae bacterium]HPQ36711.1 HutP family protein [Synergistaceae bacterium]